MAFHKTHIFAAAAVAGALASPALSDEKVYDFKGFSEVSARSGVTVNVTTGDTFSVRAVAHRGNLDRLDIDQSGDRLIIDRHASWGLFGRGKRDRFEVWLTLPALDVLESRSGSSVLATDLTDTVEFIASSGATLRASGQFEDVEITSKSGASLQIDGVFSDLDVTVSGGASMKLDGQCDHLDAVSKSGAALNAKTLVCTSLEAQSTGGASLRAHARETAVADARSGASLTVFGQPEMQEQRTSGGASIRLR